MDFETLPKARVNREAAERGDCKYLALLITLKVTGEQKRLVWATGYGLHSELCAEVLALFPENAYTVVTDGGGLLKIKNARQVFYLYGTSTNYGPDLYLRSTMAAIQSELVGMRAYAGNP